MHRFDQILGAFALLGALVVLTSAAQAQPIPVTPLDQPPLLNSCWYSDGIGDSDPVKVVADDFVVTEPVEIGQVRIWGFYLRTNSPGTDSFTVVWREDKNGSPGSTLGSESAVPSERRSTGRTGFWDLDEYEYDLNLDLPIKLFPGTYWVEVYNDLSGDTFCWQVGTLDETGGREGMAVGDGAPGSDWQNDSGDLSLQLNGYALDYLTISPPSGEYVGTQEFDLVFIVRSAENTVVGGTAYLNDVDISSFLASCLTFGSIEAGQTFRCPGIGGPVLGPGTHTLRVTLDMSDREFIEDEVVWEVLDNSEP